MKVRLVIAGSRTVSPGVADIDRAVLSELQLAPTDLVAVICGCAHGADRAGAAWAEHHRIAVHHEPVTSEDWSKGKYIGPRDRNRRMAKLGDVALIFWDGLSGGSADMAMRMLARKKPVYVIPFRPALERPQRPDVGHKRR